ncbi:MAG: hypothetical protein RLZZ459_1468 [Cyanobacteriota bacterium]|jgi:hypothetical protein
MAKGGTTLKPRSVHFGRPLLAWRPHQSRASSVRRALFAVHSSRPQLIAAWHQGTTLDAAGAQKLWEAHPWELIDPPADVVRCLDGGQSLLAVGRQ